MEQIFNGDQEMVVEIVQDFINHQGLMITEMENALTELNYNLVASLAHKIRSSLQTVGLNSLFDLLAEIEVNANERKNIVSIHQHFQVLKETCDKAVLELHEYLSEL